MLHPLPKSHCTISAKLVSINVVRLDERQGDVSILAGENIVVVVGRDGEWSFR